MSKDESANQTPTGGVLCPPHSAHLLSLSSLMLCHRFGRPFPNPCAVWTKPKSFTTDSVSGSDDVDYRQQDGVVGIFQDLSPLNAIQPASKSDASYTVIGWDVDDSENPHNWSFVRTQ
jgi:hypothetical protein